MTLNWTFAGSMTATAVAASVLLCPVAVSAQSGNAQTGNPWNPYPVMHTKPTPDPVLPASKPKYYQEVLPATPNAAPSAQAAPPSPSRFAPADLSQRLSAPAPRPQNAVPYGYGAPAMNPNSQAYSGQPRGYANGYPQGYNPMNAPPNFGGYGGYGPPIIGNNNWGSAPGNNFFPFGF